MPKPVWIALPLLTYVVYALVRAVLGRSLPRRSLHIHASLLLAGYFFATAAAGVFWVANQQLPPFDLHYLLGYVTAALVLVHLAFSAPSVIAHVRGPRREPRAPRDSRRRWAGLAVALVLGGLGFVLGLRHGSTTFSMSSGLALGSLDTIERYHSWSSHGRASIAARAPSVDWSEAEPFLERAGPTIALPAPRAGEALAGEPQSLASWAALLHAGAGITERRGGLALRAAASSGALFPTELYLVRFEKGAMASGIHHYAPERHSLVRIADPPSAAAELGLAADDAGAEAYVVLTSVFRRSGRKYRDRTYRYVAADAGHVLANLLEVAPELGLQARLVHHFDEARIAALLGIDEQVQGVLALLALDRPGRAARPGPPTAQLFVPAPAPELSSAGLGATAFAHHATSLRLAAPATAAHDAHESPGVPPALSPSPARQPSTLELVARRRSRRSFASTPVPSDALSGVLSAALGRPPELSRALAAWVLVESAEGTTPGSHRYTGEGRPLKPVVDGSVLARAGGAALDQTAIARAPVVVLLAIDREALRREGPRGYRHALLEAGIVGGRIYLEAERRGLGACTVGAFLDEEIAEVAGLDPERWWVVQLSALGVRAD
jgi:SagB-type dehydrogenase family enzyme